MSSTTTPTAMPAESIASDDDVTGAAQCLLDRIRNELIELDPGFGVDSNLFDAGLDSMAIMQVLLIVEEEFGVKLPDRAIKRETFATAQRIAAAAFAPASLS